MMFRVVAGQCPHNARCLLAASTWMNHLSRPTSDFGHALPDMLEHSMDVSAAVPIYSPAP
eukprot:12584273-Heterocapsa_arctica.AAC.1